MALKTNGLEVQVWFRLYAQIRVTKAKELSPTQSLKGEADSVGSEPHAGGTGCSSFSINVKERMRDEYLPKGGGGRGEP